MVVNLHGGNPSVENTYRYGRSTQGLVAQYVAAGWVVFSIDYRANGPGRAAPMDPVEYDDTMAAIDTARHLPFVDSERVALTGGSHGGHVMNRMASRVNARCAVLYSPTWIDSGQMKKALQQGKDPVVLERLKLLMSFVDQIKDPAVREAFDRASALHEAPQVRFPLLIINGGTDISLPQWMVKEYVAALRANGKDVEAYLPDKGDHGFYGSGSPESAEAQKRTMEFLKKHLAPGIHEHPGGKEIPASKFIRVVSETESPVQQLYIKSKDGLSVAAALRKPKGNGPFPTLIYFHGWPGGRGMEELTGWVLGVHGSPVLESFLQKGFVVVAGDYRRGTGSLDEALRPIPDGITYLDDCLAVVDHVRSLPFVDGTRINLYGSSFGANLVAHVIGRRQVHAAVIGGAVITGFLGADVPRQSPGVSRMQAFRNLKVDEALARKNVGAVQCPLLIIVGKDDFLTDINQQLYDWMVKCGKTVRLELYENVYHGFEVGPRAMAGPPSAQKEPVLEGTLDALDRALEFVSNPRP